MKKKKSPSLNDPDFSYKTNILFKNFINYIQLIKSFFVNPNCLKVIKIINSGTGSTCV